MYRPTERRLEDAKKQTEAAAAAAAVPKAPNLDLDHERSQPKKTRRRQNAARINSHNILHNPKGRKRTAPTTLPAVLPLAGHVVHPLLVYDDRVGRPGVYLRGVQVRG
jgi:hypothetical protein